MMCLVMFNSITCYFSCLVNHQKLCVKFAVTFCDTIRAPPPPAPPLHPVPPAPKGSYSATLLLHVSSTRRVQVKRIFKYNAHCLQIKRTLHSDITHNAFRYNVHCVDIHCVQR